MTAGLAKPTARTLFLLVLLLLLAAPSAAEPTGTVTWAVHGTLPTRWLDTSETEAEIAPFLVMYGLHDALVKPMGVFVGANGAAGNASTRIEPLATARGVNAYGTTPEIDGLFQRQIVETDRKKREEMLHQLQRMIADRVMYAPIWEKRLHPRLRPPHRRTRPHPDPVVPLIRRPWRTSA